MCGKGTEHCIEMKSGRLALIRIKHSFKYYINKMVIKDCGDGDKIMTIIFNVE